MSGRSPLARALRAALSVALLAPLLPAAPGTFLTVEEALDLAFEGCDVERVTHYLTEEETQEANRLGDCEGVKRVAFSYTAEKEGELVGTAWFDTHRVRTLRETLMIVVRPDGHVDRIEVLAFGEPEDYIPRTAWYAQFLGKRLEDDLRLRRGIKNVTGATLTANATSEAVRRVLAMHRVIGSRAAPQQ